MGDRVISSEALTLTLTLALDPNLHPNLNPSPHPNLNTNPNLERGAHCGHGLHGGRPTLPLTPTLTLALALARTQARTAGMAFMVVGVVAFFSLSGAAAALSSPPQAAPQLGPRASSRRASPAQAWRLWAALGGSAPPHPHKVTRPTGRHATASAPPPPRLLA